MITKPKSKDLWIFVGGKPEEGETMEQALVREVKEELGVGIAGGPKLYLESPVELAAGDPGGRTVQVSAFTVEIDKEPEPCAEIEKLHWLSKEEFEQGQFQLGSILQEHAIPKLIADGLM